MFVCVMLMLFSEACPWPCFDEVADLHLRMQGLADNAKASEAALSAFAGGLSYLQEVLLDK